MKKTLFGIQYNDYKKTLFGIQYNDYEKPYRRNFDQWKIDQIKLHNMETKKKINWTAIWLIIKNILIALLTANALEQRL